LARYEGQGEFEGIFRGGCKEGRGTFKFPNTAVYEGRFKNDRLDGSGTLKIDRAFVKDVIEDSDDRAIVSAICGMARSLGLAVVAEGVETEAQSMCLGDFGIKLMQGYHFSRPVPAEQFETLLRSTSGGRLRALAKQSPEHFQ
jgi:hypothetical protein